MGQENVGYTTYSSSVEFMKGIFEFVLNYLRITFFDGL